MLSFPRRRELKEGAANLEKNNYEIPACAGMMADFLTQ
jgi:hypothetical protein